MQIDVNDPRNADYIAHPYFLNGVKHGTEQERERIIALIEQRLAMLKLDGSTLPFGEHELRLLFAERCIEVSHIIALIKGENE